MRTTHSSTRLKAMNSNLRKPVCGLECVTGTVVFSPSLASWVFTSLSQHCRGSPRYTSDCTERTAAQRLAAAESDELALTLMKVTEEEMLLLDSPLLEKYHGRETCGLL